MARQNGTVEQEGEQDELKQKELIAEAGRKRKDGGFVNWSRNTGHITKMLVVCCFV